MNTVNLIGRLTKDVELRKVGENISTTSFTLAVDKTLSKADKEAYAAQGKPTADFISCVAWRQSADILATYARKGSMIAVEGRVQTRTYQNQTGQNIYVTEILVNNVQLLGGNTNNGVAQQVQQPVQQPAPAAQPVPQAAPAQAYAAPQPAPQQAPVQMSEPEINLDISSDDLPFY